MKTTILKYITCILMPLLVSLGIIIPSYAQVPTVPTITTQPSGNTLCVGQTFVTTVVATDAAEFEWYQDGNLLVNGSGGNGSIISGATTATLTISNLCATCNPGDYTVTVISASGGETVSDIATLVVNSPSEITTAPLLSYNKCEGEELILSVVATGTPVPTYQWQKGGLDLVGETGSSLTLSDLNPSDAGTYSVTASNSCGDDTYGSIVVSVNSKPVIVTSPVSSTKCAGETQTFTVSATNAGSYQWYKDNVALSDGASGGGSTIAGSTSSSLTISNLCATCNPGVYHVVVTGSGTCSSNIVSSADATLTVNSPADITTAPLLSYTKCEGEELILSVVATGTPVPTYQWQKGGLDLVGETGSSLTLSNMSPSDAGTYSVTASNSCGSDSYGSIVVSVNSKPVIVTSPVSSTKCAGETQTFTISATNAGSYQWYKDNVALSDGASGGGSTIAGSTSSSLTISNLCATCNPGVYHVEVAGSGVCSSNTVSSADATLTVNSPADITTAPLLSYTKCEGEELILSVVATGSPSPTYQWQKGGVDLVGKTGASLTLSNMNPSDAGAYSVTASNSCGSDSYGSIVVSVNSKPVIVTSPVSSTKCAGETQTFTVSATNAGSYQWYKDNVALSDGASGGGSTIAGSTSSSLTISNLCATCNPGVYHVEVAGSGVCSSNTVSSADATLTVNSSADITTAPLLSYTKCEGEELILSVVATGSPSPTYQWQKGGVDLVGKTGASLTLSNMNPSDAGAYSVTASNSCGSDSYGSIVVSVNSKPVIVTSPVSSTKCAGETQTFTVSATNAGSYQWYKDNVALSDGASGGGSTIAGATSSSLTISNLCATCNPGVYHVVVTGNGTCSSNTVSSASATLTVNSPADITTAPLLSYTKCEGEELILSVVATGNPSPTYQWQKGGINLVGETGSSLTLSDLSSSDAGTYSVTASNSCGSDSYGSIVVSVNSKPVIVTSPVSSTKCVGATQTFIVSATNAGGYQWYKDNVALSDGASGGGSTIAGATSSSLTISNLCATCNPGVYHVEVTGSGTCSSNTVSSSDATLTVNSPADITTAPLLSYTKCEGEELILSVVATGSPSPTYQWQKGGVDLVGKTGSSLTLSNMSSSDAGTYSVMASNSCGSDSYGSIVVSVNSKPVIVTSPVSSTKCAGETQTFTVSATNAGSYQWYKDNVALSDGASGGGSTIAGSTSSSLTISNLCATCNPGVYHVEVAGSGVCSSNTVSSASATLVVNSPADITTAPLLSYAKCEGEELILSVVATGSPSPTYQWQKGGVDLVGKTGSGLTLSNMSPSDAGTYSVTASNSCGSDSYGSIVVSVNSKPVIVTSPVSSTKCAGETQTFTVSATNAGSYQWYKDNVALSDGASGGGSTIAGSTSSSLTISNLCATCNPGVYHVEVAGSGVCSSNTVSSASATLVVNSPADITTAPLLSYAKCEGEELILSVVATGSPSPTYQWQKGGVDLVGKTGSSLTLSNMSPSDAGTYSVTASNSCGSDSYGSIVVSVNSKPVIVTSPVSSTKCAGETQTFTISATNAGSYQWYKDNVALSDGASGGGSTIAGSTSSSLTISNLCATCNPGVYHVVVTGSGTCSSNTVSSASAMLVVNSPADITTAPLLSYTKCEGEELILSVVATGSPSPTYQWQKGGVDLVGKTGASLTLSNMSSSDAGTYSVTASNSCGSDSYGSIVVSVNSKPVIVTSPVSSTKCVGATQTFTVSATNAGGYQWYKDNVILSDGASGGGSTIAGSTSSSLTISNLCATCNPGVYHVVVTGSGTCSSNTVSSAGATLTVNEAPKLFSSAATSYAKCEGDELLISTTVTGNPAPTFQWKKAGVDMFGQTTSTLTLSRLNSSATGSYTLVATNSCGSDSYGPFDLVVNLKPVITLQPSDVTLCAGLTQLFAVNADNAGSYQWYFNNAVIAGQTKSSASIDASQTSVGSYKVVVSGMGACKNEAVTSNSVYMAVNDPITIVQQPKSQRICENESVLFTIQASGTKPAYQWYKDNTPIIGATESYYGMGTLNPSNAGNYKVEIKGTCSVAGITSQDAVLTVTSIKAPVISSNKPDGMCVGQSTTLTATACAGTVHWYSDGNEVATGLTYTTTSTNTFTARCEELGCYSLTTSNAIKPVQLSNIVYKANKQQVTCFGGSDGTIELVPSGSFGSEYAVSWQSLTSGLLKVTDLKAGDYTFTIKDKAGCSVTGTETITQASKPSASIKSTDITCFNAGDGKITLTAGSDYGNFSYILNQNTGVPFQTASTHGITNLLKGSYSIKVVDAKGCEVLPVTEVKINEPTSLSLAAATAINPKGATTKDGSVSIGITGGTKPYSVAWFDATGISLTTNIATDSSSSKITLLDGGTYKVVVTDKNLCQQTTTSTLLTPAPITITAKVDSISCFGKTDGKLTISLSGGVMFDKTPAYLTAWKRTNLNGTVDVLDANATTLSGLSQGTYTVTVIDVNGISANAVFTLKEPSLLKATVSKIAANYCASSPKGEITLLAEGGRMPYNIKLGNTNMTSLIASQLSAGSYTITVVDNAGCTISTQAVVPDSASAFSLGVSYEQATCFGRCDAKLFSKVVGGFAPYQYNWTNVNATVANPIGVCGEGTTSLEVKDAKGCVLKSQTLTLTSPSPRVLGLAPEKEVCPTQTFDLTATSLTWAKTFVWTLPNGKTKTGVSIQADTIGVYKLTALDENSCGGQQVVTVVPNKNVSVLFTIPSKVPVNKEVIAVDFSSPNPTNIKWVFPTSVSLVSQDTEKTKFKFSQIGFFTIKELATINNCEYPLSKVVEVVDKLEDKNFPATLNYVKPADFVILGNPTGNNYVTLQIDNEANEAFTISVSSITDSKALVEKSFEGDANQTITIPLPTGRNDYQYIVTLITPTVKTSKKLLVFR